MTGLNVTQPDVPCTCNCSDHGVPGGVVPPFSLSQPPEHAHVDGKSFTFSAKTCKELLPHLTDKQLAFEIKYHDALGIDFGLRITRNPTPKSQNFALDKVLADQIPIDFDNLVNNISCNKSHDLISNISRLLTEAEQLKNDLQNLTSHNTTTTTTTHTSHSTTTAHSNFLLPSSVSILDPYNDLQKINIADIVQSTDIFTSLKGRKVAYFGNVDYLYSGVRHVKCPYPVNTVFDDIFSCISSKLELSDFNRDNYTCLLSLYESGDSFIPFHSDNEPQIEEGSSIYTVSFGATREVLFRSLLGAEESYSLHHGSVHIMSQASQTFWEHSIPRTSCDEPRVSLTFRKMNAPQRLPPVHKPAKTPAPPPAPIEAQSDAPPSCNTPPKPRRVLFLTDSIHSRFPTHLFPKDVVCVRKPNFLLSGIGKYEAVFGHFDLVFISCGVNDLSRHDMSALDLSSFICNKLKEYTSLYPSTVFMFNSLLETSYDWLNREILILNENIFKLSSNLYRNLWFLDTHEIFVNSGSDPIDRSHGIHITFDAKRLVNPVICTFILTALNHDHSRPWPLRPHFKSMTHFD